MNNDTLKLEIVKQMLLEAETGHKSVDTAPRRLGFKHDPTFTAASGQYSYGNGGLFSTPGQEPTIFASIVQPLQGVASALPVMPTGSAAPDDPNFGGYLSPYFTTITGVTDEGTVTEPDEICDDQPTGGEMKVCRQTSVFGRIGRGFRVELTSLDQLLHRGQPTDLNLMNPILQNNAPLQIPSGVSSGMGRAFLYDFSRRMMIAGIQLQRKLCPMVWSGDPTNNSANGGYAEFLGLNTYIATGNKVDAIDGTPCPSMNPDVKDFGFNLVNGSGNDIVKYVDMLYHYVNWNAGRMGMNPVKWIFAMRPELFDEIVKVWPVRYYQEALVQMQQFANGRVVVSGRETTDFRDDMRNNAYLPIRGVRIPVVLDSCIPELQGPGDNANLIDGQYASDIYLIPMTVLGGIPVTYWEFNGFNQLRDVQQFLGPVAASSDTAWATDGGQFLWRKRQRNTCLEFDFTVRPRIIFRTPYLAGRIQNVAYEPLQHTREPLPSDAYFVNGGSTNTPTTSVYTEWSTSSPVVIGQPGGQY